MYCAVLYGKNFWNLQWTHSEEYWQSAVDDRVIVWFPRPRHGLIELSTAWHPIHFACIKPVASEFTWSRTTTTEWWISHSIGRMSQCFKSQFPDLLDNPPQRSARLTNDGCCMNAVGWIFGQFEAMVPLTGLVVASHWDQWPQLMIWPQSQQQWLNSSWFRTNFIVTALICGTT